jgi:hypothetical protein
MAKISGILRAYDAHREAARNAKPAPPPPAPVEREDETEFFLRTIRKLEAEDVWPDTRREPRSIHSPAQASRIKFVPPVKRGHGRTKRFAVN